MSNKFEQKPPKKQLVGRKSQFDIKISLESDQTMKIHIHDQNLHIHQVSYVNHGQVKRQSQKNGVQNIIDSAPMLFMALQDYILERRIPLSWVVDVGANYIVKLNFELKINFRGGSKKKNLVYQFSTIRTTGIHNFKVQGASQEGNAQLKELQQQNRRLKNQLKELKEQMDPKGPLGCKFDTLEQTLLVKNNTITNINRDTNYIYLRPSLHFGTYPPNPEKQHTIKFRAENNALIHFDVFKYQSLKHDSKDPNYKISWYKKWIHCKGSQIVTAKINETGYTILVEKNQIEEISMEEQEEGERMPNFSYGRERIAVDFKRMMIPLASMHFGIGLDFAGRIQLLAHEENPFKNE